MRRARVRAPSLWLVVLLAWGCAVESSEDGTTTDVEAQPAALLGGQSYVGCSYMQQGYLRRAAAIGRTVVASRGFAQCMRHVFEHRDGIFGPYVPFPGDPPGTVEDVIARTRAVNPMRIECRTDLGTALGVALPGTPDHEGPDAFAINGTTIDWAHTGGTFLELRLSVALWHEGMHTHGYLHRVLLGPFMNQVMLGYTDTVPEIVGHCMRAVVEASAEACGVRGDLREPARFTTPPVQATTCGAAQLPIVTDYPGGDACECVRDAGRAISEPVDDPAATRLGVNQRADAYATALASGDFNGDGTPEVVVGGPGETTVPVPFLHEAVSGAGAVYVYEHLGGGFGLSPDRRITGGLLSLAGGRFGSALAAADFDSDGFDDLAVGAPEAFGSGAVFMYLGSPDGLRFAALLDHGSLGSPSAGARFGAALAVRRAQSSRNAGLVVGAPGEAVGGVASGAVYVYRGDAQLVLQPMQRLTQASVDGDEAGDRFGAAVASAALDTDRVDDVIVGAPGEDGEVGRVYVFFSHDGLLETFPAFGVLLPPAAGDGELRGRFGASLAVGHFVDPSALSVAVGQPAGGVLSQGVVRVYEAHRSVPETTQYGRLLTAFAGQSSHAFAGAALATLQTPGALDHLAVGAPGAATLSRPGAVDVVARDQTGGALVVVERIEQAPLGSDELGDRFGAALLQLDLSKHNREIPDRALLVGAPGDAPGGDQASGAAFLYDEVLYGESFSRLGPRHLAWQSLDQDD